MSDVVIDELTHLHEKHGEIGIISQAPSHHIGADKSGRGQRLPIISHSRQVETPWGVSWRRQDPLIGRDGPAEAWNSKVVAFTIMGSLKEIYRDGHYNLYHIQGVPE